MQRLAAPPRVTYHISVQCRAKVANIVVDGMETVARHAVNHASRDCRRRCYYRVSGTTSLIGINNSARGQRRPRPPTSSISQSNYLRTCFNLTGMFHIFCAYFERALVEYPRTPYFSSRYMPSKLDINSECGGYYPDRSGLHLERI